MSLTDEEISKLLIQYRDIVNLLRERGVIRSSKVVSDYGEHVACRKLGLKLVGNSSNKWYDAIDREGKKYEIKTRKATSWNKPTKFPIKKEQLQSADFLIYVEFDDDWSLGKLLKIPTKEVKCDERNAVVLNKNMNKYSVLINPKLNQHSSTT